MENKYDTEGQHSQNEFSEKSAKTDQPLEKLTSNKRARQK